jgi:N-acetylglutamate synthase-like GNAT family acetyltransferase
MQQTVITYYLEMNSFEEFCPKAEYLEKLSIRKISGNVLQQWMLFFGVGLPWRWYSRLNWSFEDWSVYFANPNVSNFIAFSEDKMAGYFELVNRDSVVEINFLGLFPDCIGEGLGGELLSHALDKAWKTPAKKVWLHTCTSDHPMALKNYLSRGFKIINQTVDKEDIPEKEDYEKKMKSFIEEYIAKNW